MTPQEREKLVRIVVNKAHPDRSKEWREARVKELLGVPAADPARKPVKKTAKEDRARLEELYNDINKRMAAFYGVKNPGEVQYR